MNHNGDDSPRITIPGAAGHAISAALSRMATHCGEVAIQINKERVAGGGYVYTVSNINPPARPVNRSK
jgi:hypothetical protein